MLFSIFIVSHALPGEGTDSGANASSFRSTSLRLAPLKKICSIAISYKKTLIPTRSAHGLMTTTLPSLPYEYEALEPVISGEIMRLHHLKHHETYVIYYNTALELLDSAMKKGNASAVVGLQSAIKFNGGGEDGEITVCYLVSGIWSENK